MKNPSSAILSFSLSAALFIAAPGADCYAVFTQSNARASSAHTVPALPAMNPPVELQAPSYNLNEILAAPHAPKGPGDLALPAALEPAADVRSLAEPERARDQQPTMGQGARRMNDRIVSRSAGAAARRPAGLMGKILDRASRLWSQTSMDNPASASARMFDNNRRPILAWTLAAASVLGSAWQAMAGDNKSSRLSLAPAAVGAVAAAAQPKGGEEPMTARLYETIHPKNYDIKIALDPEKEDFKGEVEMAADVVRKTKTLTLHALELDIEEAYVNGRKVAASDIRIDKAAETVSLALGSEFSGPVTIKIKYSGKLNHQMKGLYQSSAKYQERTEHYAFTQFEATDARRMFVGIDEPEAKAEFDLTVIAPEHLTVLSNMPAEKETRANGFKTVTFQKTPRMSSYLLSLDVARLESKSIMVGKTKVTAWAMPQDVDKLDFALETARQALTRLSDYMGVPYPLPELKLVAVPDFAMGAMENWGSISFRDSAILLDSKIFSAKDQRRVAEVVIHEIVHQWFGNLVTMKWWNDLWLNEAFATWLSYKVMDQWHPEWNIWREFTDGTETALQVDALRNTRPVSAEVRSSAEIEAMFDRLTYEKGGSILRMIENFLGEKKFREGIRSYIRAHQYGNTVAADLWGALEQASGQPVARIAKDWLEQPGYPIVEVASLSKDNHTLRIAQRPFYSDGKSGPARRWTIPVVIRYKLRGDKKLYSHRVLLEKGQTTTRLPGKGVVEWAYPNQDRTGYYRVALDEKSAKALSPALKSKNSGLATLERMGLLNDAWARAKKGEINVDVVLDLIVRLKNDRTHAVQETKGELLRSMADFLAPVSRAEPEGAMADQELRSAMARLTQDLLGKSWERLGWKPGPKEDDDQKLARADVLLTLGSLAPSAELKEQVLARADRYVDDPASIDSALAGPLLALGARMEGNTALFERYWAGYLRAATPQQKVRYLKALAAFRDPTLVRRMLAMTLSEETIRGQDMWMPMQIALGDPQSQGEAWQFIRQNWAAIRAKTGTTGSNRISQGLSSLWRQDYLDQVKEFFAKPENQVPAADRSLKQSLENMELGIRFRETQAKRLSAWLKARYP